MARNGKVKEKGDLLWFRMALALLPFLARFYFKIVDLTSRKIFLNREYEEQICPGRSFAVASFHGTALYPGYYCRRYEGVIMVSRSWDGELIDRCLRGWGYYTARGSSSRNGKEALQEMIDLVKERNCASGMAVDAPRGPARKVKIGVVLLAKETSQPVIPVTSWTTRHVQFRSWDSMILPLPFSTIVVAFGKPVKVPQALARDDYERIRLEIEHNLISAQALAEEKVRELKQRQPEVALKPLPTRTPTPPL
jgi:lysophospholipid acyltransferase (LPLAT)-like uncharacterized protein